MTMILMSLHSSPPSTHCSTSLSESNSASVVLQCHPSRKRQRKERHTFHGTNLDRPTTLTGPILSKSHPEGIGTRRGSNSMNQKNTMALSTNILGFEHIGTTLPSSITTKITVTDIVITMNLTLHPHRCALGTDTGTMTLTNPGLHKTLTQYQILRYQCIPPERDSIWTSQSLMLLYQKSLAIWYCHFKNRYSRPQAILVLSHYLLVLNNLPRTIPSKPRYRANINRLEPIHNPQVPSSSLSKFHHTAQISTPPFYDPSSPAPSSHSTSTHSSLSVLDQGFIPTSDSDSDLKTHHHLQMSFHHTTDFTLSLNQWT